MSGLKGIPGRVSADPRMDAVIRGMLDGPQVMTLAVLEGDPDRPGEGDAWIVAGASVYLRVMVRGTIKQVALT